MTQGLVIVESPAKIKTIRKYLGGGYEIMASLGHVKDLPKKNLGIDLDADFTPTYEVIEAKKKTVSELKKAARKAEAIYLAPDPDREGEAIAWHIADEIGGKGKGIFRVLFNDLSKNTVLKAINNPLKLDFNKYEAQQTRRILDRLVGYKISPLLWDKVKRGLSAGRVQSVAVRLICDREAEIGKFVPKEYWNITATLEGSKEPRFEAKLSKIEGKKAQVINAAQAEELLNRLKGEIFKVAQVEMKEVKKAPPPPFTTSKLQQEGARWLRFSPHKTMRVAQSLYEGIELGSEGSVGLITYMRTDSVRIAEEAVEWARDFIAAGYGREYLPAKPRFFKNQSTAQDAHEAIRPISGAFRPQDIKHHLTSDQFKLYQLIWNRFIASQINPAVYDQTVIEIAAGNCLFRAQGSILRFPGFTAVYKEGKEQDDNDEQGKLLPPLALDEVLLLIGLAHEQLFTQPPPRFTEASLVKELEEKGIGRPSTYAAILSTIQERKYVLLEQGRFHPTELGQIVNDLLINNFPHVLDVDFTASLEKKLDEIEEGKNDRLKTLREFYSSFSEDLLKAKAEMKNIKREETPTDLSCEKCNHPMVIKWGKNGRFLACSNYPECKNTRNLNNQAGAGPEPQLTDHACDICGRPMAIKKGRFGSFLGCSGYPDCKNIMPLTLGIPCPETDCGGSICEKKSKTGKTFYSCSRYPACKYAIWDRPSRESCPSCQAPFLVEKQPRRGEGYLACLNKSCGYRTKG